MREDGNEFIILQKGYELQNLVHFAEMKTSWRVLTGTSCLLVMKFIVFYKFIIFYRHFPEFFKI